MGRRRGGEPIARPSASLAVTTSSMPEALTAVTLTVADPEVARST